MEQELRNVTDDELLKAMKVLGVDYKVTVADLKRAYQREIRMHHTDKGGSVEAAKSVTTAYRVLKTCLETGRRLPNGKAPPQVATSSSSATDGTRRTGGHKPQPYKRQRVYPYYTVEDNFTTSFFFDCADHFSMFDSQFRQFNDVFSNFPSRMAHSHRFASRPSSTNNNRFDRVFTDTVFFQHFRDFPF